MRMRSLSYWLFVVVFSAVGLLTIHAESPSGFQSQNANTGYNGVWKGQYGDRVFVIVTLSPEERGSFQGTIAVGDIGVDENGEVNEVTRQAKEAVPISNVNLKKEGLTFDAKANNDLLSYDMKAVGTNKAKLQVVGAPPNIKPFTLERVPEHR